MPVLQTRSPELRSKQRPPRDGASRMLFSMRALGPKDLPERLVIGNRQFKIAQSIKHDFWAATGFYESTDDDSERVVLKISRTADFCGFPLFAVGKFLCRREMRMYRALADLSNVPRLIGRAGPTGFVHAYAPGRPLSRDLPIPDNFFDDLWTLIREIHRRDIAYVDTNKPQNILHGADGRPHLIDFQISFDLRDFGNSFITRWLLRRLQREDFYHLLKHKKSLRPDLLSAEERLESEQRSWFIRLHRAMVMPYKRIRRRTFKRLRESGRLLPEGSK